MILSQTAFLNIRYFITKTGEKLSEKPSTKLIFNETMILSSNIMKATNIMFY